MVPIHAKTGRSFSYRSAPDSRSLVEHACLDHGNLFAKANMGPMLLSSGLETRTEDITNVMDTKTTRAQAGGGLVDISSSYSKKIEAKYPQCGFGAATIKRLER